MNPAEAPSTEFREGVNDPSPIMRVIALDWYDGPTSGVLQLGDAGPVYRFAMLDEHQLPADTEVRVYGLYPLPPGAFERLAGAISSHMTPRWPVWVPLWQFPADEARQAVENLTDGILKQAGPLTWVVMGDLGGGPVRALPVRAARAS
jgi:hypothetical protein